MFDPACVPGERSAPGRIEAELHPPMDAYCGNAQLAPANHTTAAPLY
jgi:hypothetical protein